MPAVTFAEAARRLHFRSRSTLYRLKDSHQLDSYLVEGENGSQLLELLPKGRPPLAAYLKGILDRGRGPQTSHRSRREESDSRWEEVASRLSEVLAEVGGPSLTAREAELLARRLGAATWEAFPDGLPRETSGDVSRRPLAIEDILWDPLASEVNSWLVADGWRFPRLAGWEVLLVWRAAEEWMEGTEHDTESQVWWKQTLEEALENPEDPSPDPWKCEWCGKPWHTSHPDYERPPQVQAFWKKRLAELGASPPGEAGEGLSPTEEEKDPDKESQDQKSPPGDHKDQGREHENKI
jgi:hypothetical protein